MLISYRWLDNMQDYSMYAFQALQTNLTKRNAVPKNQRSRIRINANNHYISNSQISNLVLSLQKSLDIQLLRPFGAFNVLRIVFDRTMRVVLVLRGYVIEKVLIKAFSESFEEINTNNLNKYERRLRHCYSLETDDTIDIWTPSQYEIFQTITDHANAAILHFYAPLQMESAIKAYLVCCQVNQFGLGLS